MSLSILIPSDSELVQRPIRSLTPEDPIDEKDSIWRLSLYEVWSLQDSVKEILLQIELLTMEVRLASHLPKHWPHQKQLIVDGILILMGKGLEKKCFDKLSYYFCKMVEATRKVL